MSVSSTNLTTFLPVIPASAMLYQRATTNPIGVTAATATNIGYLAANKTQLEVASQLTGQDPIDMYSFTLQQGSNTLNLNVTNVTNSDGSTPVFPHVQLLDGSGLRVIADNQGTAAQQQAYAALTSTTGLSANAGQYIVKVTYGNGASKNQAQTYAFQLDSGGGGNFTADYRTLAAPTTVNLTLLQGGSVGYSTATATASMLTNLSQGGSLSIFNTLDSIANAATTRILA